jgi:hypothetical protein
MRTLSRTIVLYLEVVPFLNFFPPLLRQDYQIFENSIVLCCASNTLKNEFEVYRLQLGECRLKQWYLFHMCKISLLWTRLAALRGALDQAVSTQNPDLEATCRECIKGFNEIASTHPKFLRGKECGELLQSMISIATAKQARMTVCIHWFARFLMVRRVILVALILKCCSNGHRSSVPWLKDEDFRLFQKYQQ